MPFVFVYLMDGKKPICFWKAPAIDYKNAQAPQHWVPFAPDKAVGKI